MKKNKVLLPTLLVAISFMALLTGMLVQVFVPAVILPSLNIPAMVTISVASLLFEYLFIGRTKRNYIVVFVFGALSFALLPLVAGFACIHTFWKFGAIGAAVFTITTFLFTSATQRIENGKKAIVTVLMLSVGIRLTAQCFAGILI